jgi:DNA-binding PadR family transcriptional regulator
MSAGVVVLGLLVERPDNGYQLERRLDERLGSAQFGQAAAHHALKRLKKQGFVRLVDGQYVATVGGVEHFERWLRSSTTLPPMREELLARFALCRPKHLPRLIHVIREAELACMAQLEDLNERTREEERSADRRGWEWHMGLAVMTGDAAWWDARIKWLGDLRVCVQNAWLAYEAELRAAAGGRA